MKDEIKEILDKFDKVLENYELDKKWGQMSVDSICHLFPNEMIIIKDCITNLQEENERLKEIVENLTTMTVCGDRKQIKNTAQYKLEIYKSRNEKAIRTLETLKSSARWERYLYEVDYLLNILNGGDDNE